MNFGCGYNPRFTDTVTGIQAGLSGLNGIIDYFSARNSGANVGQAVAYGLGSTTMGVGNALLGNAIDKTTHSYLGTTMNSVINTFTGGNPYAAAIGLPGTAFATSIFMVPSAPAFGTFGYYSAWPSQAMFSGPVMFGMPPLGGFCCYC